MKKVLLRGPVLTQSGYGVHSRQVARWLLSKDNIDLTVQALPWGITPWLLNPDEELIGRIMSCCRQPSNNYDVTFQVQLPNEWDTSLGRYNVGITAAVETDRCNPSWVQSCQAMDSIIVPSTHAKQSLTYYPHGNALTIDVIGESFPDSILEHDENCLDLGVIETDFNLLVFGQLTGNNSENDRKNLLHTIRTLCEAFANSSDVGIFLKTNSGKSTKIDRFITRTTLTNVLTQVRKGPYPRFYFLHGTFDDREIASLYRHPKVTALVSLTRGEGFGLPILEAAASDLPVIATDWSGYLDFMNLGKFIKINRDIKEIHPSRVDPNIFMKDARWAFPDEQDFKEKMLKFYRKNEKPRTWARQLGEIIRERYSFQSIASMYDLKFGKILGG